MESVYKRGRYVYPTAFRGIRSTIYQRPSYAFSGARGGVEVAYRNRNFRRRTYGKAGYSRRAGFYGRFGTGRGRSAQIEKKFFDTAIAVTADLTAEAITSLNVIPQGATQSQRVGYKCVVKSIQWRLRYELPPGATGYDDVYMWVIQDTQTNGAVAAFGDVFDSTVATTCLRNIQNGSRFKVLAKEKVSLNSGAGVAAAFEGDIKCTEGFLKVNIPLVFNGATGAVTEMRTNNILMMLGAADSDDVVTVNGNFRLRYTDQ